MKIESFSGINNRRKKEDVTIVDISIGKGMKWIKAKDMIHEPRLAPTVELLDGYKKGKISEEEYIKTFKELYDSRKMKEIIDEIENKYSNVYYVCFCGKGKFCHRILLKELYEEDS